MADADKYTIQTTKSSLEILEAVRDLDEATPSRIADTLGKSDSSVFKHLQTLSSSGFLTTTDNEYELSLQFLTYGLDARRNVRLDEIAQPDFEWLAEATDARVNLAVKEEDRIVCIRSAKPEDIGSEGLREGRELDARATALGRAILSQLPEGAGLEQFDSSESGEPSTAGEPATIDELVEIRDRGFATSTQEGDPRRTSLAAPIFTSDDRVAGSIGVSVEGETMDRERLEETYADIVVNASQRVSKRFRISDRTARNG